MPFPRLCITKVLQVTAMDSGQIECAEYLLGRQEGTIIIVKVFYSGDLNKRQVWYSSS